MNYSLVLSLEGAEKVEQTLAELIKQLKELSAGFSVTNVFSGGGSSSISKQADDIGRLTRQMQKGQVGAHALGRELKNLGQISSESIVSKVDKALGGMTGGYSKKFIEKIVDPSIRAQFEARYRLEHPAEATLIDTEAALRRARRALGVTKSEVDKMFGKDRARPLKDYVPLPTDNPMYEAMQDLKRHGDSAAQINKQAAAAMLDIKKNLEVPPVLPPGLDKRKLGLGLATALFNPWISSRLISDALPQGFGGVGGGRGIAGGIARGIFGSGGALGFGEIYLAINAIKTVINGVKAGVEKLIEITQRAMSQAYTFYTQAIQQGLGQKFFTQRSILASVLGVSGDPNQIFRFGAALQNLSERLNDAITIISSNERPLAATAMNFKVLRVDLDALYSEIASLLSPSLDVVTYHLENMVKTFADWIFVLDKITNASNRAAWGLDFMYNMIRLGGTNPISAYLAYLQTNIDMEQIKKNREALTTPLQYMKQLGASSWEKMGLIVGGSGPNNVPALIRQSNQFLRIIATHVTRNQPWKTGAGHFGLNPNVANP